MHVSVVYSVAVLVTGLEVVEAGLEVVEIMEREEFGNDTVITNTLTPVAQDHMIHTFNFLIKSAMSLRL
jgi:hypothetical protein